MKAKLQALLAKHQSILSSLNLPGWVGGLLIGYFGHPVIKLGIDAVLLIIKGLLRI